jgi:beta-lactamase superfamily II metal-dependent hydrolase
MPQPQSYKVTPIHAGASNAYLITGNSITIMVDSGSMGNTHKLKTVLKNKGLYFVDIDYIILTHSHYDHVGSLIKSWKKLLSTGYNIFYPGHGKPFSSARFEECYSKKKDYT